MSASRRNGRASPSTSPASTTPIQALTDQIDYFELLTGASWTSGQWTLGVKNYWSPDNFQFFGDSNAIEGTVGYTLQNKWWNFFTPSLSGTVGFQSYEKNAADYTYWNAGLTLGFLEHWSADIRYYDTNYNNAECLAQSGGRNIATRARSAPSRRRSRIFPKRALPTSGRPFLDALSFCPHGAYTRAMRKRDATQDGRRDEAAIAKAHAIYTPVMLSFYDMLVHGFSNRFAWKCPTGTLHRSLS